MPKEKIQTENKKMTVAGLDIDAIVKKAQANYGKNDKGLASQLSTGANIFRPTSDEHFVKWTGGDHWQQLTGVRGIPFGSTVQISGKSDSGKSTHAMQFMKYAQDQDVLVILWDSEKKFSKSRFEKHMGGDASKLLVVNNNTITKGAAMVAYYVNAAKEMNPDCKILIVWDSVGATLNSSEDKDDTEDASKQPGISAKENSGAIHKFVKLMSKYQNRETGDDTIAALLINQTYANIGSVGQVEKGGSSIYYLSSIIVQLTRKGNETRTKNGEKYKWGIRTRARVVKNHLDNNEESIAELELIVSAAGIQLAKEVKSYKDTIGWGSSNEDNNEEEEFTEVDQDEGEDE